MKNQIRIIKGDIERLEGDVVLNWITSSFKVGPIPFIILMQAAGPQPLEALSTLRANIKEGYIKIGDSISTIPGQIKYNLIIHSVVAMNRTKEYYNLNWFNIIKTLRSYKKSNVCRNLYLTLPDSADYLKDFFNDFLTYQNQIEDIEFVFVARTEIEKKEIEKKMKKICPEFFKTLSLSEKIDKIFLKLINGHNKKKLQKNSS